MLLLTVKVKRDNLKLNITIKSEEVLSMDDFKVFHARLKEAREKAGMTQKALADKINVSVQTISVYEREKLPTLENLVLITEILNVSVDWLLGKEKPADELENLADVFSMIESLEFAFQTNVDVKKETIGDPYDRRSYDYDSYEITFRNCFKALGDALIAREAIDKINTDANTKESITSVWRKGTIENLRNRKIDDEFRVEADPLPF